jgi:phosphoglycolate phosphatase
MTVPAERGAGAWPGDEADYETGAVSGSIDVAVFDWDGTLIDSTSLIAEAILRAAQDIDVRVPDRAQASHVIGLGLAEALARVVPDLPRERIPAFAARYHVHFRLGEEDVRFFDGARELLQELRRRGLRLAVATGRTTAELTRSFDSSGTEAFFEAYRCADQTHPKPHPAMLFELAEELQVAPARMVMIGDTSHDLHMAAAAGVPAVAMTHGAHARSELERLRPAALCDSIAQLQRWLLARCP